MHDRLGEAADLFQDCHWRTVKLQGMAGNLDAAVSTTCRAGSSLPRA